MQLITLFAHRHRDDSNVLFKDSEVLVKGTSSSSSSGYSTLKGVGTGVSDVSYYRFTEKMLITFRELRSNEEDTTNI